jgi:hypothetical protein
LIFFSFFFFLQKVVVLRVVMNYGQQKSYFCIMAGRDARTKAMRIAVSVKGVDAASLTGKDKDQIEVKGEGIDAVKLATIIRKKVGHAEIVSVAEDKKEEKKPEVVPLTVWPYQYYGGSVPSHPIIYQELDGPPSCSIM